MESLVFLCFPLAVLVILVLLLLTAIRIVREYERLVIFRLGKSIGARGPGLILLIPIVDVPAKGGLAGAVPGDSASDLHYKR